MKTSQVILSKNKNKQNSKQKMSKTKQTIPNQSIRQHMPTLGTIKMVEEALKSDKTFSSKNKLWRSLPKQIQYPTFTKILDYLEESNKIIFEKDGSIAWTFVDTKTARKSLKESTLL